MLPFLFTPRFSFKSSAIFYDRFNIKHAKPIYARILPARPLYSSFRLRPFQLRTTHTFIEYHFLARR